MGELIKNRRLEVNNEMALPLVSVIINCYNGEKYLRDAIDSVIAQSYEKWEIIFWDNQSQDRSKKIFMSYNDSRLRYFFAPKHTVLYEARNYAINKARGELYAFLDVDDWWSEKKLEMQLSILNDNESIGLVYGRYWLVDGVTNKKKKYKKNLPSGMILNDLLKEYVVGMLTVMVRKDAYFSLSKQFDKNYNIIGDFDFVVRLASRYTISCVQTPIAYCRKHDDNMSKTQRDSMIIELENWVQEINQYPEIYKQKNFSYQNEQLLYLKFKQVLADNGVFKALALVLRMQYWKFKIKSFIYFVFKMS